MRVPFAQYLSIWRGGVGGRSVDLAAWNTRNSDRFRELNYDRNTEVSLKMGGGGKEEDQTFTIHGSVFRDTPASVKATRFLHR